MSGGLRRRRTTPVIRFTARGGVMLVMSTLALVFAYILGLPELLVVSGFVGAPPLLALGVLRVTRPKLSVTRSTAPITVGLGQTETIRATVENLSNSRVGDGHWHDTVPWQSGCVPQADFPALPARSSSGRGGSGRGGSRQSLSTLGVLDRDVLKSSVALRYSLTPPHRGVFDLGPVVVTITDPFGLVRGDFSLGGQQPLVVTPHAVELPPEALQIATADGSARHFQHQTAAGDPDLMTRSYRPGDALRRVHWRSSARHGELMVRESEQPRRAEVIVVLETRGTGYSDVLADRAPDQPESESFEWALQMIASVNSHLGRLGIPVEVVETALRQLPDADYAEYFSIGLARIRLSYSEEGWAGLAPGVVQATVSRSAIVAILGDPDTHTVDRLIGLRTVCDVAVAFLVGPGAGARSSASTGGPRTATDRLRDADWLCANVGSDDSPAEAWESLGKDVGRAGS